MKQRYPHTLSIYSHAVMVRDDSGSFVRQSEGYWEEIGPCRESVNGDGSSIVNEDGVNVVYSSTIYLPMETRELERGTFVRVSNGDLIRFEGEVTRAARSQSSYKLWVKSRNVKR